MEGTDVEGIKDCPIDGIIISGTEGVMDDIPSQLI
jgi:hypothetical protein